MNSQPMELLIRGDDAGGSLSANRAIEQCHRDGVVTNASVMAIGAALQDAADRFAAYPELCVGLHVALNSEWLHPRFRPVLPPGEVPSLVDEDGYFLPSPQHLADRGFNLDEADREVRAQLDRLRSAGLAPRYADEHMGVGRLGGLADRIAALCKKEGLIFARDNARHLPPVDGGPSDRVASWLHRIQSVPAGRYVLVTHPLFDDDESRSIHNAKQPPGAVAADRDTDRRSLIDPRMIAACRSTGVRLLRYSDATSFAANHG